MKFRVKPKDFPCRLEDMESGLFLYKGTFALKTHYTNDIYICNGGEVFWGGVSSNEERNNLIVMPIEIIETNSLEED